MTRIIWDSPIRRFYETGVSRGVFYPSDGPGVPWNGLVSVSETSSDSTESFVYQDGIKRRNTQSPGEFSATLEALTYPDEIADYTSLWVNGRPPVRKQTFNLSYQTDLKNDHVGLANPYCLHLVYNALAKPNSKAFNSESESTEPVAFGWDITTTPFKFSGGPPSSHIIIDGTMAHAAVMNEIEAILYGTILDEPRFPTTDEVLAIFESHAIFRITYHEDDTFTASGPDSAVRMVDAITFELTSPSVVMISADTYKATSL